MTRRHCSPPDRGLPAIAKRCCQQWTGGGSHSRAEASAAKELGEMPRRGRSPSRAEASAAKVLGEMPRRGRLCYCFFQQEHVQCKVIVHRCLKRERLTISLSIY
ncbi:hypothetical protein BRADI_1g70195v3 [Brachypodium distachyon]|uniref:Uncharacterized protein n=1 Tax=Brachypodium distachyon TaxID=15368 RepID=A0A2K2DUE2_BRADI|nr:hypothetical protein BRADI_1g70195v3 [Brachypodium distachyon]